MADRSKWRLLGQMFIADTMDDAIREVGYSLRQWLEHMARLQPGAPFPDPDATITQLVDQQNESEGFVIGTPDMAIRYIEKLREKSGGFGCFLLMGAEYARWPAMLRHYELIAEEVMPHFSGQLEPIRRAYDRVAASGKLNADRTAEAQAANRAAYEREVAARKDK